MNTEQLLQLKEKISKAQTKIAELEGERRSLNKSLQALGCKTIEEAEDTIAELQQQLEQVQEKQETLEQELQEKYPEL